MGWGGTAGRGMSRGVRNSSRQRLLRPWGARQAVHCRASSAERKAPQRCVRAIGAQLAPTLKPPLRRFFSDLFFLALRLPGPDSDSSGEAGAAVKGGASALLAFRLGETLSILSVALWRGGGA